MNRTLSNGKVRTENWKNSSPPDGENRAILTNLSSPYLLYESIRISVILLQLLDFFFVIEREIIRINKHLDRKERYYNLREMIGKSGESINEFIISILASEI